MWLNAGYISLQGLLNAAAEAGLLLLPPAAAVADVGQLGCSRVDGSAPEVTAAALSLPRQVRAGQPDAAAAAGASGSGWGRGFGGSSSFNRRSSSMTAAAAAVGGSAAAAAGAVGSTAAYPAAAAAVLPFCREALYSLRYHGDLVLNGTVSPRRTR
jgi:hypothetical protein